MLRRYSFRLLSVLFVWVVQPNMVGPALAQDGTLAGAWRGVWIEAGDALPVTLTFSTGTSRGDRAYSGTFASDELQVAGIPLSAIREDGGKVHFEVRGDRTTTVFDGTVAGDTFAGTFVEGTTPGQFRLVRTGAQSGALHETQVTFRDGDVTLAGTLYAPLQNGRHPAILFLQGSGPEGRWANRYLAIKFAEAGVVALIYDKRGVGDSSGDWRSAGFETLAGDGAAGVRFLRSRAEVDPAKVGIYGHSQGGTIAPLVATQAGGVDFIIASAAGGLAPAEVEVYSVGNAIGLAGLPPAERAAAQTYIETLIDVAYRGGDRARLDELASADKDRSWYFPPPPPGDPYWTISRQIAIFRPAEAWRGIRAPVLLVYGQRDERVPPQASIAAIRAALPPGVALTVRVYPGADHTFTLVEPSRTGGWPRHVPDYAAALIAWVQQQSAGKRAVLIDRAGALR